MRTEREMGAALAARQIETSGEVFAISWGTPNGRFGYEVGETVEEYKAFLDASGLSLTFLE